MHDQPEEHPCAQFRYLKTAITAPSVCPRDLDFDGVSELEIVREGDSIILRPVRPTWGSFAQLDRADPDFMAEREDVVSDEGRFDL
ncbi:vagC protein [Klebsiella pneumoniae]|nr:vagC protein [Klebsiella pneumoniae]